MAIDWFQTNLRVAILFSGHLQPGKGVCVSALLVSVPHKLPLRFRVAHPSGLFISAAAVCSTTHRRNNAIGQASWNRRARALSYDTYHMPQAKRSHDRTHAQSARCCCVAQVGGFVVFSAINSCSQPDTLHSPGAAKPVQRLCPTCHDINQQNDTSNIRRGKRWIAPTRMCVLRPHSRTLTAYLPPKNHARFLCHFGTRRRS